MSNRKRSASEPVSALLGEEAPPPSGSARPASITLGSALVLGRAVAAVLWIAAFSLGWPEVAQEMGLSGLEVPVAYGFIVGVWSITALVLLLFAWLIWRGSNIARVITMIVLTLSIIGAAVSYFTQGAEITVRTTLLTLAFDILILLALSSRDARAWVRRRK